MPENLDKQFNENFSNAVRKHVTFSAAIISIIILNRLIKYPKIRLISPLDKIMEGYYYPYIQVWPILLDLILIMIYIKEEKKLQDESMQVQFRSIVITGLIIGTIGRLIFSGLYGLLKFIGKLIVKKPLMSGHIARYLVHNVGIINNLSFQRLMDRHLLSNRKLHVLGYVQYVILGIVYYTIMETALMYHPIFDIITGYFVGLFGCFWMESTHVRYLIASMKRSSRYQQLIEEL